MTSGEATAVNIVVMMLLGQKRVLDSAGVSPKVDIDVAGAAALLADKAHRALGAGLHGDLVRELWNGKDPARCAGNNGRKTA